MITAADSSSSSTTSTISTEVEATNKQSKVNNDELSKCALSEEEKENLNKGSLIRNNSVKYFRE